MIKNPIKNYKKLFVFEWVILILILSIVGAMLAGFFYLEFVQIGKKEENRLITQVGIIKDNLTREIRSVKFAHKNIQSELQHGMISGEDVMPFIRKRMRGFKEAIYSIRSMTLLDKNGKIIHSTLPSIIGKNFANREYFWAVQNNPQKDMLYISSPYTTSQGAWTINITTMVLDKDGGFNGVITAALDAEKLTDLLSSVFYAQEMWSAIAHKSGMLFLANPKDMVEVGKNINQNNSFFVKHVALQKPITIHRGKAFASETAVFIAEATVDLAELNLDNFLVVAVAREYDSVFVEIKRNVLTVSLLYLLVLIISFVSLFIFQKKRVNMWELEKGFKKDLLEKNSKLNILNDQLKVQSDYLEKLAFIDGLTGVANRRRFNDFFEREFKNSMRESTELSLIMIDIDHFKFYNDFYGHQEGDECLKAVAFAIANSANRPLDLVARYGGEEFVVLLPATTQKGAVEVAEKTRKAVEALALPHAKSPTSSVVTVSLGVASKTELISSGDQLLALADQALYCAKNSGRNQVATPQMELGL